MDICEICDSDFEVKEVPVNLIADNTKELEDLPETEFLCWNCREEAKHEEL